MVALTTSAKVNAELGTTGVDYSESIAEWSAAIESYCNRSFASAEQVDTFRITDPTGEILLSRVPVSAVASVVEAGVTLAAEDYELNAKTGVMLRLDGDEPSEWVRGKIVVTYTAGYVLPGDDDADLPGDIERACIELVARAHYAKGRDPALRSYESPDVERMTFMDADRQTYDNGIPDDVAGRLQAYRIVSV